MNILPTIVPTIVGRWVPNLASATIPPSPTPTTAPGASGAGTPVLPDGPTTVTFGEFFSSVIDTLVSHGYQTGVAAIVTAIAVVAMVNSGTHRLVTVITGVGAFWAGWLGWNSITGDRTPLFPGEISTINLWDVAIGSPVGFMIVAVAASITAVFLWRSRVNLPSRILLIVSATLGASFVYNVFEAFRTNSGV